MSTVRWWLHHNSEPFRWVQWAFLALPRLFNAVNNAKIGRRSPRFLFSPSMWIRFTYHVRLQSVHDWKTHPDSGSSFACTALSRNWILTNTLKPAFPSRYSQYILFTYRVRKTRKKWNCPAPDKNSSVAAVKVDNRFSFAVACQLPIYWLYNNMKMFNELLACIEHATKPSSPNPLHEKFAPIACSFMLSRRCHDVQHFVLSISILPPVFVFVLLMFTNSLITFFCRVIF